MSEPVPSSKFLSAEERDTYQWQIWVPGFGEEGQAKLKNTSVLISRAGGLGGVVAYQLAAAGVGKLVIAHAGNVKHSDLNRQLLMTHDWLGKPRIESVKRRLNELNPHVEVVGVPDNVSEDNVKSLVDQVDIVVDAAPLFEERFAMNDEAVRQRKPMVECAMFELESTIFTILPRKTACLRCICPAKPPEWRREFPVFGAVSGTVGCMAAMEVIKVATGLGKPLAGQMVKFDLRDMTFRKLAIYRDPNCPTCGTG